MNDQEALLRITDVMRSTFKGGGSIPFATRETTANDVQGWDSLSHAIFILNVETEFDVELPLNATLEMENVGNLVDLIASAKKSAG